MSTHTLKSVFRRGSLLGAVFALVAATLLPSISVYADSLNPLTERSLLLSSSAPGFQDSDGSSNSETNPNAIGEYYALPGSGPNGKKSGETFTFRVSTDTTAPSRPIKAITFQYCTNAAGNCQAPGDNDGDARSGAGTPRETNAVAHPQGQSDLDVVFGADDSAVPGTDFDIYVDDVDVNTTADPAETVATGWDMKTSNVEDTAHSGALTGKKNFITLYNASSTLVATPQTQFKIVFKASSSRYITNPGSGSFFVKINTYDSEDTADHIPAVPADENTSIIDGGVTVANVMTDSIHITTKVLETMSFSVGTKNRDTATIACTVDPGSPECEGTTAIHGTCDPIQQTNNNRLNLGNPDAEYSLETDKAWDVKSYWRLSSNSSGGATVYYSGNTLANTVGDEIQEVGGTKTLSTPGTEQFGLAFVDAYDDDHAPTNDFDPAFESLVTGQPARYRNPGLYTLGMATPYDAGEGEIGELGTPGTPATASFAFLKSSSAVPEVIASDNDEVITCATAKMRYVANIGADTPAGVYTTKINYLAAPQY